MPVDLQHSTCAAAAPTGSMEIQPPLAPHGQFGLQNPLRPVSPQAPVLSQQGIVHLAQHTAELVLQQQKHQHQHTVVHSPGGTAQQQDPAGPVPNDPSTPRALTISCNGNYGVYLVARHAVQCLCQGCRMSRATEPQSECWLVSPTEFERHSGMPSAKKWRSSIRVAHDGEPDITLGRWLDAKGLTQRPPAAAAAGVPHAPAGSGAQAAAAAAADTPKTAAQLVHSSAQHQEQQHDACSPRDSCQQQLSPRAQQTQHHVLQQQHQLPATAVVKSSPRDSTHQQHWPLSHPARQPLHQQQQQFAGLAQQLGQLLAAHYKQQQQHQQQPGVLQQQSSGGVVKQQTAVSFSQQQPVCSSIQCQQQQQHSCKEPAGRRLSDRDIQMQPPSVRPQQKQQQQPAATAGLQPAPAAVALHAPSSSPVSAMVMAAAASEAAAQAEAAAADASGRAYEHCQHKQQQRSRSAAAAAALKGPPGKLQIPCPADGLNPEIPAAAAAAAVGDAPVALEAAAAAAAMGDDSLWLRSPKVRRTPRSAHGVLPHLPAHGSGGGGTRKIGGGPEAAAAEVYRRLVGGPGPAAEAAAAEADEAAADSDAASGQKALAGAQLPGAELATAAVGDSPDQEVSAADQQQGSEGTQGSEGAAGEEEDGIAVGPKYQADLPLLRPLPALHAAAALLELRKAGRPGPTAAEALAIAVEEKARADLLPRDAVEDVWERTNGALALERAQRQRRAPGWQAAFIDPLKPYSLTGGPPGGTGSTAAVGQAGQAVQCTAGGDGSEQRDIAAAATAGGRGRKRSGRGEDSCGGLGHADSGCQEHVKRARCSSTGGSVGPAAAAAGRLAQQQPSGGNCARLQRGSSDGGPSVRMPCNCTDPYCPVNQAAAAAAAAQQQHPSGLPRGPGLAAPPVPSGWSQGSGLCRTPIGPQLLSWLLLNPAAAQPQLQTPTPVAQTPVVSRAGSEVGEAAATAAAAATAGNSPPAAPGMATGGVAIAVKEEGQGVGAAALPASPESAAQDGNATNAAAAAADSGATSAGTHDSKAVRGEAEVGGGSPAAAAADTTKPAPQKGCEVAAQPAGAAGGGAAAAPPPTAADSAGAAGSAGAVHCAASTDTAAAAAAGGAPAVAGSITDTRGVVEVRIVLDGCVFVGQLQEVARLDMSRSRLAAALQPITQVDTHEPAPLGTCCTLCHMPEAPGCHADQATAAPSTGMSRAGLGPLMPVSMAASEQQQQQHDGGDAAAAAAVVWVHRQCALWSPEVYPDRRGILMHLPGAIQRGHATRCSGCGEHGATLKCAERSCLSHFHLACARQTGCTLIAEPYTVACPAHPPKTSEPQRRVNPVAEQQPNPGPEPKLRCRTTRAGARLAGGDDGTPAAAGGEADTPFLAQGAAAGGPCPMDVDAYESDATPTVAAGGGSDFGAAGRALAELPDGDDEEMSAAALLLSGFKRARGGQSRLRRQSNSQDWANNHQHQRQCSPDDISNDQAAPHQRHPTPTPAGRGPPRKVAPGRSGRAVRGGSAAAGRGSFGSLQMHDSRGRFMSHAAAAALAAAAATSAGGGGAAAAADECSLIGRRTSATGGGASEELPGSAGGSPWLRGQAGPEAGPDRGPDSLDLAAAGRISEDGGGSEASGGTPLLEEDGQYQLGGTTGQPGRAGRCAVCVIQRKGKCGTESAPKKCLRRQLLQQQKQKALTLATGTAAPAASSAEQPAQGNNQDQEGLAAADAAAAAVAGALHGATNRVISSDEDGGMTPVLGDGAGSAMTAFTDALHSTEMAQELAQHC